MEWNDRMDDLNSNPLPEPLAHFPAAIRLPVQWGDQDAFGHVNNTVYFRWFESARIKYLERIDLSEQTSGETLGPILAAVSCNYRRQVKYPDHVVIGARITRLGRSSMAMTYVVWSETQQAVAAEGDSTVVAFDYAANKSQPIPAELRKKIEQIEGHAFLLKTQLR
jgi:acyl-CoA thioester hydrolase